VALSSHCAETSPPLYDPLRNTTDAIADFAFEGEQVAPRFREKTMELRYPLSRAFYSIILATILLPQQVISQTQSPSPTPPQANANSSAPNTTKSESAKVNCTSNGTYVNSKGQTVKRPETCSGPPKGATAHCVDGTYSFSQTRRGTCSHHGGVAKWL
jgi:hypothetical protein